MYQYIYHNIILIALFISLLAFPQSVFASKIQTDVKASLLWEKQLNIFGFTSPQSLVQAVSIRTFALTSADSNGFFYFKSIYVSSQAQEICLISIDSYRRSNFPTCVSIDDQLDGSEIGPILLSPTLSLSQKVIWTNNNVTATGQTLPNSHVAISFFDTKKTSVRSKFSLTKQVLAIDLPVLTTQSDSKGNFSLTVPTHRETEFRFFAKAFYDKNPTPKSQTLFFKINPKTQLTIVENFFKVLVLLSILVSLLAVIFFELKNNKIRGQKQIFSEKIWIPFAVKLRLKLRRLWYNLREWWKLHQIRRDLFHR